MEHIAILLVCLSVYHKKLWYFHSNDFLDFWQDDRGQWVGRNYRAGFPRKIPDHSIITKTCQFRHIFEFWRKSRSETPIFYCRNGKNHPSSESLRKPHVRENSGSGNNEPRVTPIDAIFAFFGHIEWSISGKVHNWPEWYFRFRKTYTRTTYPEKISHRALVVHDIWPPRFL